MTATGRRCAAWPGMNAATDVPDAIDLEIEIEMKVEAESESEAESEFDFEADSGIVSAVGAAVWVWVLVGVSCQDQNYCHVLPSNLALSNRSDPTPISTIPTWHSAFSYYFHHLCADCIHRDRDRPQWLLAPCPGDRRCVWMVRAHSVTLSCPTIGRRAQSPYHPAVDRRATGGRGGRRRSARCALPDTQSCARPASHRCSDRNASDHDLWREVAPVPVARIALCRARSQRHGRLRLPRCRAPDAVQRPDDDCDDKRHLLQNG